MAMIGLSKSLVGHARGTPQGAGTGHVAAVGGGAGSVRRHGRNANTDRRGNRPAGWARAPAVSPTVQPNGAGGPIGDRAGIMESE